MAYTRIGNFRAKSDKIDELISIYESDGIPLIRKAAGNISAFICQKEGEKNIFMACTIWASKADAENYEKSGQAIEMVNKIKHTFDGPPQLTTYETFGLLKSFV